MLRTVVCIRLFTTVATSPKYTQEIELGAAAKEGGGRKCLISTLMKSIIGYRPNYFGISLRWLSKSPVFLLFALKTILLFNNTNDQYQHQYQYRDSALK